MNIDLGNLSPENSVIHAIHTSIKGRARYKVSGLHNSQALKRYLEFRLPKEENIIQASANHFTGNVLLLFHPEVNLQAIAWLLQNIVLDYRRDLRQLPASSAPKFTLANVTTTENTVLETPINQWQSQLVPVSGAFSALVVGTGLLHKSGLDAVILLAIQKLHTPLLDRIMVGITSFGQPPLLVLTCLVWEASLLYRQRQAQAATFGIAAVGAISLNYLLKEMFVRTRPALWDHIINVNHYSFPSGHAMVSMVVYGLMGYTLAEEFPQWRKQILALTAGLILAIGFSRLYLGVHWPTDVVAGYAAGLVWLTACVINESLQEQRQISLAEV
ncbi:phosphatase PAP2 family protein [Nostoc sp. FACHB-152]|uniref:phosphatase PAP2 family protein n=1 Tax=unclassified Nostoc TaxID=2593658 RepID=UPI001683AC92|nr:MULTISPECIES: phosphatase PAP2 family protein [unclassified Nostoc]MBD2450185.1 phosphatase PAP2 family protein [Nostoc sp. FACHB-152]MBD2469008.1 phosphatase PAP2 family protein [Nostoc sp. FACHB-145]